VAPNEGTSESRRTKIYHKYQETVTARDWDEVTIIGCEPGRMTQWIKEAVKIWQESQVVTNRDGWPMSWAMYVTKYWSPLSIATSRKEGSQFEKSRSRYGTVTKISD